MDLLSSGWLMPVGGIVIGALMGFVARSNHFCTLAALERYWYAGDSNGVRSWTLAAAVALLSTLVLQAIGVLDLSESFYLTNPVPVAGAIVGGLMFGLGMALVGTCGFGAIVRMGGGNLRALVVLTGIALAAIAALRGTTGHFREAFITPYAVDLASFGAPHSGSFLAVGSGFSLSLVVGVAIAVGLLIWILKDAGFRKDKGKVWAGTIIGLAITAGWVVTFYGGQAGFSVVQMEAGSFVAPLGDLMLQIIVVTGELPDYGVGLMVGVFSGAALAAWRADDMRWEACDDARELGRHLAGAFLMGTGGVFAFGCTIGQGVSAVSALAFSVPLALGSIILGARIGLSYLLEGTFFGFMSRSSSHPAE